MKELLNLLNDKNKLLIDMQGYIKSVIFYGEDNEVDAINEYVEKKQTYIDALASLQNKIDAYSQGSDDYTEVKVITEKNQEIIHSIIALDKERIKAMEYLRDKYQQSIKGTKIQRQYNVSYNNYVMDIRGSVFDSKQ